MSPDPRVTETTPRRRIPSETPPPEEPTSKEARPPEPELGWSSVTLPSRGRFYGDALPGGVIQVRPLMATEMAMLATQGGSPIDRIIAVLRACGRFGQLDLDDMLATDQLMAAFGLRSVSYGNEYSFDYYCERCSQKQRTTVDIAKDCNEKPVDPDQTEPLRIPLPDSKLTVLCRFLRVRDMKAVLSNARRARQAGRASGKESTKLQTADAEDSASYLYRLALSLVGRVEEGQDVPFQNVLAKEAFLKRLTAKDSLVIERTLTRAEPGIDTTVYLTCGACGADNEMTIPFDAEFFRPTNL